MTLQDISRFENKVTSTINERPRFTQDSEIINNNIVINWPHLNKNNDHQKQVQPYISSLIEDCEDWITSKTNNYGLLILVHLNHTLILLKDDSISSSIKVLINDIIRDMEQHYKEFGFSRKRKLTIELLKDSIAKNTFTTDTWTYIAKYFKKNICVLTINDLSFDRHDIKGNDEALWIIITDINNVIKTYNTEVDMNFINNLAKKLVPSVGKKTKLYEKFIGTL
jgi:hypothetical protein